jgi:MFS family permease
LPFYPGDPVNSSRQHHSACRISVNRLMRTLHTWLLFSGTLLTALGYGATFLLTEHFRTLAGSEVSTGLTLAGAMVGTFLGVPLVGSFADRLGAARMAAMGALLLAVGYQGLASLVVVSAWTTLAGLLIGLGWGIFYLAAPLSLSARVTDDNRAFWFARFGAFQMGGIGLSPIVATALIRQLHFSTAQALSAVAAACVLACVLLWTFEIVSQRAKVASASGYRGWLGALPGVLATRARYPILMVGLGACVFTGLMTFQTSLVRGTGLEAGTYFAVYGLTVVLARLTLASSLGRINPDRLAVALLVLMCLGVLLANFMAWGVVVQVGSAILLGLGYGLVYSVIQTQVVNDAPPELRHAALTWFVLAYFVGIFGFPLLCGWLIVHLGTVWCLAVVLAIALAELLLALKRGFRPGRAAGR